MLIKQERNLIASVVGKVFLHFRFNCPFSPKSCFLALLWGFFEQINQKLGKSEVACF